MLILQPKLNEWIVLQNARTGSTVARLKIFLNEGRSRIAFDIPKEIQVIRSLTQGSAGSERKTR